MFIRHFFLLIILCSFSICNLLTLFPVAHAEAFIFVVRWRMRRRRMRTIANVCFLIRFIAILLLLLVFIDLATWYLLSLLIIKTLMSFTLISYIFSMYQIITITWSSIICMIILRHHILLLILLVVSLIGATIRVFRGLLNLLVSVYGWRKSTIKLRIRGLVKLHIILELLIMIICGGTILLLN